MEKEIIEVKDLSLSDWLSLLEENPKDKLFACYEFPTFSHREEYLSSIATRSDEEILFLLRKFLIKNGSLGNDEMGIYNIKYKLENNFSLSELDRRRYAWAKTKGRVDPWEGITWIIDLLPHNPGVALDVLDAYFIAHCTQLPDGRMIGIEDSKSIIRAKYILSGDIENTKKVIQSLGWRELEVLTAKLFKEMGYDTILTSAIKDGGKDVVATREEAGSKLKILIECKKYNNKIGVSKVRELYGTVQSDKFNKGILVTTSSFTRGAVEFAQSNNIDLLGQKELIKLLNEFLGRDWCKNIDLHLRES